MKLYLLLILVTIISKPLFATDLHAIMKAIQASDPVALRYLLIAGFSIKTEEKKKFLVQAQQITNRTYTHLHKNSVSDLFRFIRGGLKMTGGLATAYTGYNFYKGYWDKSTFNENHALVSYEMNNDEKKVACACLGLISSYLLYKGSQEWMDILSKQQRFVHHRAALAVEAIIHRLPTCDTTEKLLLAQSSRQV